jgi:hypothetical protein
MLDSFLSWVQATPVASTISQSLTLNGLLSSMHLVGIALLVGGVLVSSLRLMGAVLMPWPADEVTRTARRAGAVGLSIAVATGALLVSPRIVNASESSYFQAKMVLVLSALLCHVTLYQRASTMTLQGRRSFGIGALGLALWLGVVLAGAAFILLE